MRAIVVCTFVAVALCGVASAQSACNGASGMTGPTCTADEDCCGYGTMFPQCVPKNSGSTCCVHFKGATTCNSTQTCCGSLGPGASSSAFCCNEGSTCCKSGGSGTGSASCCPSGSQCCAASNLGFCCRADQKCNLNTLSCDDASSASTTTAASSLPAEVTTAAPPVANCRAWSSTSGATCTADEDCCGADTMFPQCIPKNSGKQCCTHFKGAATCNSTQTCCGSMGPGASSSAFCCDEGSTCCKSGGSGTGSASCCPAGSQCCGASNLGFCCRADQVCNLNTLSCDAPAAGSTTTAAPAYSSQPAEITTAAPYTMSQPAEVTTTAAPTTAAPYTAAPTTAAPYTTSQPAEVTTSVPMTAAPTTAAPTTAAPTAYGSQPAEVTTQSPNAAPSTQAPVWDSYSPAPGQASWAPVFASFAAVLLLAVVFH